MFFGKIKIEEYDFFQHTFIVVVKNYFTQIIITANHISES